MVLLEVGWSLPPRGRDRPRRPLLGTADGPRRRESCRGDRGASAATDDRSRDHRVPRDRALHRLGVLARVGLGKLTASSRPRPRIVMSASERASWLGVRPRLRRRCHPRSLGRCSRRREGDHRDTRPSPSRRDFYLPTRPLLLTCKVILLGWGSAGSTPRILPAQRPFIGLQRRS